MPVSRTIPAEIKPVTGEQGGGLALRLVALSHLGNGGGGDLVAVVECVADAPEQKGAVA